MSTVSSMARAVAPTAAELGRGVQHLTDALAQIGASGTRPSPAALTEIGANIEAGGRILQHAAGPNETYLARVGQQLVEDGGRVAGGNGYLITVKPHVLEGLGLLVGRQAHAVG